MFDSEAGIAAAQLEQDLVHRYQVSPQQLVDGLQVGQMFRAQQVGMVCTYPWGLQQLLETNAETGMDLDVAPLPQFFDGPRAMIATSHIYTIPIQRTNDDSGPGPGAEVHQLAVPRGQCRLGGCAGAGHTAAAAPIAASTDPVVRKMSLFIDQAKYAHFAPYAYRWNQAFQYLNDAMDNIVYQRADVASELRAATARATETMKEPS